VAVLDQRVHVVVRRVQRVERVRVLHARPLALHTPTDADRRARGLSWTLETRRGVTGSAVKRL
jgi:hypothetical protein